MAVKDSTIVINAKDGKTGNATQGEATGWFLRERSEAGKGDDTKTSNTPKNTSLPSFSLNLDESLA